MDVESSENSFQIVDYFVEDAVEFSEESSQSFCIVDREEFTDDTSDSFSIVDFEESEADHDFDIKSEVELSFSDLVKTARPNQNGQYLLSNGKIVSHKRYQQMLNQIKNQNSVEEMVAKHSDHPNNMSQSGSRNAYNNKWAAKESKKVLGY